MVITTKTARRIARVTVGTLATSFALGLYAAEKTDNLNANLQSEIGFYRRLITDENKLLDQDRSLSRSGANSPVRAADIQTLQRNIKTHQSQLSADLALLGRGGFYKGIYAVFHPSLSAKDHSPRYSQ